METKDLLAEVAKLIVRYGPDAPQVQRLIDQNQQDKEFVELAELSRTLKRAFIAEGRGRRD